MKSFVLALSLVLVCVGFSKASHADIVLDDIAPKISKCWGSTCVIPAAAYNATLYNLKDRQWEIGAQSLGGGADLLFNATSAYSFGIAAHLTGVLAQGKPSFVMPSIGVIVARYGAAMFHYRWSSSGPGVPFLSLSLNLPFDVFTPATLPTRWKAARLAAARGE